MSVDQGSGVDDLAEMRRELAATLLRTQRINSRDWSDGVHACLVAIYQLNRIVKVLGGRLSGIEGGEQKTGNGTTSTCENTGSEEEITPEMIVAGIKCLKKETERPIPDANLVTSIYKDMRNAQKG